MPLADIPTKAALVGSESVAVACQPVGLIVEHVVTLRAVGNASTVADDVALSPSPPPTANKALDPTAWAVLFLSEFSMIRHLVSSVEFSPAHAAGQLGRSVKEIQRRRTLVVRWRFQPTRIHAAHRGRDSSPRLAFVPARPVLCVAYGSRRRVLRCIYGRQLGRFAVRGCVCAVHQTTEQGVQGNAMDVYCWGMASFVACLHIGVRWRI